MFEKSLLIFQSSHSGAMLPSRDPLLSLRGVRVAGMIGLGFGSKEVEPKSESDESLPDESGESLLGALLL